MICSHSEGKCLTPPKCVSSENLDQRIIDPYLTTPLAALTPTRKSPVGDCVRPRRTEPSLNMALVRSNRETPTTEV